MDNIDDAKKLVSTCSIVVGMHPDEATEPIIDFALANNKPFAVVPCCVHSNKFPNRKMVDASGTSQPVRSYPQFIQYLLAKHVGIQQQHLPFHGRNIVLFHLGNY